MCAHKVLSLHTKRLIKDNKKKGKKMMMFVFMTVSVVALVALTMIGMTLSTKVND